MAKKMKSEDMWAVWNDDVGFYVDTRLSRKDMIEKHTSDLGMTWDECKKVGDKVVRVVITAAQPPVSLGYYKFNSLIGWNTRLLDFSFKSQDNIPRDKKESMYNKT